MSEIRVITQMPRDDRYTGWWYDRMEVHARLHPVMPRPGNSETDTSWHGNFSTAVWWESLQWQALLDNWDAATVLLTDLSFPGGSLAYVPLLRSRSPGVRIVGIFHAGSYTNGDLFSNSPGKRMQEASAALLLDAILVASQYHKEVLCSAIQAPPSMVKVLGGMPFYPDDVGRFALSTTSQRDGAIILGRPEQCSELDMPEARRLSRGYRRGPLMNIIAAHKVSLHPKVDETFGYLALESAVMGTVPLVPDAYAYKEFFPAVLRCATPVEMRNRALCLLEDEDEYSAALSATNDVAAGAYRFESVFDKIADHCEGKPI